MDEDVRSVAQASFHSGTTATPPGTRKSKDDILWHSVCEDVEAGGSFPAFKNIRYGFTGLIEKLIENDPVKRELYGEAQSDIRKRITRKVGDWWRLWKSSKEEYHKQVLEKYGVTPHQFRRKQNRSDISFNGTKDWDSESSDSDRSVASDESSNSNDSPLTVMMGSKAKKQGKQPSGGKAPSVHDEGIPDQVVLAMENFQIADQQPQQNPAPQPSSTEHIRLRLPSEETIMARKLIQCSNRVGQKRTHLRLFVIHQVLLISISIVLLIIINSR